MHVVAAEPTPVAIARNRLTVHGLPMLQDNLAWLLVDPVTRTAALVDAPSADPVLAACAALGVTLTTIFITHTHGDHVGILHDLARKGALAGLAVVGPRKVAAQIPGLTTPVDDGDPVAFGGVTGQVLLTEGHLDGHVSYLLDDALFSGDTLFAGGCGYLFSGPPATMAASLRRLAALPPATHVFCAHEYTEDNLRFAQSVDADNAALATRCTDVATLRQAGQTTLPSTIDLERATNPFLRVLDPGTSAPIAAAVARQLPEADLDPATVTPDALFAATRRLKDTKRYRTAAPAP